ncbi:MAG: AmmeMemoRadiSam system protein B [Ignavibacteriaceae bacterium]|nr:AmmeMemoRadiSam system protein B [Ignavibacteriaceae bacterium]
MAIIRKPAVAGMFYPQRKDELKGLISLLFSKVNTGITKYKARALVSPHAGYIYSGLTAAYGFDQIAATPFKKVIILSPSHREYFGGVCVYSGDGYSTPLGDIETDHELSDALCTPDKRIFRGEYGHGPEHAIEVQLPFLQYIWGDFKIAAVVMGEQSRRNIDALAENLADVLTDDTFVIASSDLSHFYSHQIADSLDSLIEKHINAFDCTSLQKDLDARRTEACGGGLITSMMKAYGKKDISKAKVLYRNDSSDTSGDESEVVGYLSAVIYN